MRVLAKKVHFWQVRPFTKMTFWAQFGEHGKFSEFSECEYSPKWQLLQFFVTHQTQNTCKPLSNTRQTCKMTKNAILCDLPKAFLRKM